MEQQASNCSRYHSRHRGMLFVQPVLCHNCGNCAQVAKAERHCDLCMPAVGNMARGETTLTTRTVRMYYPPPPCHVAFIDYAASSSACWQQS